MENHAVTPRIELNVQFSYDSILQVLKISEYVTLSAERKCHPLANHPTTAS
jgi:hypothetical protein